MKFEIKTVRSWDGVNGEAFRSTAKADGFGWCPPTMSTNWCKTKPAAIKMIKDMIGHFEVAKENKRLIEIIKEVTAQMHNEGTGEYTIPAWFARSLYDVLREHEEG